MVTVVSVKVGKEPVLRTIENSLSSLQKEVGGYIQMVPVLPSVDLVCNEEGMFAGPNGEPLPANTCGILGDFLFVAYNTDGEMRGLTPDEVEKIYWWYRDHQNDIHPMFEGGSLL